MSTPYVGLKKVFQESVADKSKVSIETEKKQQESPEKNHQEAKRQLIQILEKDFGILSIVVGAFQMKLSEEVPDKQLMKATQYLLEQIKHEKDTSPKRQLLEAGIQHFFKSSRHTE